MPTACGQVKNTLLLRAGAEFRGTQMTESKTHEVRVVIKSVDLANAFVCGYFETTKITETIPLMTTYFEGEIIGQEHGFITRHNEWGATSESDFQHWKRFAPFASLDQLIEDDPAAQQFVYMRWKEKFLIPDQQKELSGVSFSGFYYILLNQATGDIQGYYYQKGQAARERYQSISLQYTWPSCRPEYNFN